MASDFASSAFYFASLGCVFGLFASCFWSLLGCVMFLVETQKTSNGAPGILYIYIWLYMMCTPAKMVWAWWFSESMSWQRTQRTSEPLFGQARIVHGIHIQYYPDIQVSQVKRDFEKTALLGTIRASTSFESSAALKTQTISSNVSSAIAARKSSRLLKAWHRMAKSFKSHLVIPSITSLLRAVCWNYITSSSKKLTTSNRKRCKTSSAARPSRNWQSTNLSVHNKLNWAKTCKNVCYDNTQPGRAGDISA